MHKLTVPTVAEQIHQSTAGSLRNHFLKDQRSVSTDSLSKTTHWCSSVTLFSFKEKRFRGTSCRQLRSSLDLTNGLIVHHFSSLVPWSHVTTTVRETSCHISGDIPQQLEGCIPLIDKWKMDEQGGFSSMMYL